VVGSFPAGKVAAGNTNNETMIRCEKDIVSLGDAEAMLVIKGGHRFIEGFNHIS
jgi:hypothetical protein